MACDALQAQFIGNNNVLPTYGQNLLQYIEENNLDTSQFLTFISEFASATITSLNNRFPNRELYEAIKIYDPKQLLISNSDLANYSNEVINILSNFYRTEKIINNQQFIPPLEKKDLINEWGMVKFFLKNYRSIKFVDTWNFIFSQTTFIYDFPATSTLIQIALLIPVSNTTIERVFSYQKLIKTRLRNQMNIETLNHHLMIALNRPSIELFDFEKAYDYWYTKERRI
ncbi:294_t:CDS:1 [Scutellospora calospora]|uniref:294_t:CDS:1 n=1 Tax=Scutellospora calospora TaxID=85575 RepID=A0ACA9KSE6_9GLOM|nr:294_t:CDS:1 [Scutellospora calospora]